MSNILQNEISCSRSKKGKEKTEQRPSKKRSKVWDGFSEFEQSNGSKMAKCFRCQTVLRADSRTHGTTHLQRHLEACIKRQNKDSITAPSCSSGYREHHLAYDEHKNQELFVKMVIDNMTMLEHVDNPIIEEFARSLQPLYSHVNQRAVEEDCHTFYENEKDELKDKFSKLTSKVSLSLVKYFNSRDQTWDTCVAAHFIDSAFKLVRKIVGFINSPDEFEKLTNDWGFGKSVLAVEVAEPREDETEVLLQLGFCGPRLSDLAFGGEYIHVPCILSCFHSIAETFFQEYREVTRSIRRMMENLNESSEKMDTFNSHASQCNLTPKSEFVLNDPRGLGSEFNMLQDAHAYKKVFSAFYDTDVEWSEVEEVVALLNPINDALEILSSLEFPTSNLLLKFILDIKGSLSNAHPSCSSTTQAIHKSLEKLDKFLASCNKIVLIASMLDPQFKLRFLERCNDKRETFERFHNLYKEYQSESREISPIGCLSHTPNCLEQIPELNQYLKSSVDEGGANFDVLSWWKGHESEYPVLSRMARDILAIPISSSLISGTESLKETLDQIFSSGITTEMSKILVCCNSWLRSGCGSDKYRAGIATIKEKGHIGKVQNSQTRGGSPVWKEFSREGTRAKCMHCGKEMSGSSKSGTSHLKRHLDKCCPKRLINGAWPVAEGNNSIYDQEKWRVLLVKLVILCELPFHFVESTWFIEWAKNLHPKYIPVDRDTIKDQCLKIYQIERQRLQNALNEHLGRVCVSVCIFSKCICVTAHYVDCEFNLVRIILGMGEYYFQHLGVAEQIKRCIFNWVLDKKVLSFTIAYGGLLWRKQRTDFLNDLTFDVGDTILHCFDHHWRICINLFFKRGGVANCIREMIKFFAENPDEKDTFNEFALECKLPRKSDFQLDDPERWDSTFNMLSDALQYKNAFDAYKNYNARFTSCDDWNKVESVVKQVEPIYKAVIVLSSSEYTTANLFLKVVFEIREVLLQFYVVGDQYMLFTSDIFLKSCSKILLVASLLDPRFKSIYLERCYEEEIFNKGEVDKFIEDLCTLFENEYGLPHTGEGSGSSELVKYLQECNVDVGEANFDILKWWKGNQMNYPILSRMARDILATPVSSMPLEYAFSLRENRAFKFQKLAHQLDPMTFEALACSNNWLLAASKNHELHKGKHVQKGAAMDLVEKHIQPSYRWPLRVCDVWSLHFLKYSVPSTEMVAIGDGANHAILTAKDLKSLITDEVGPEKWIKVINCYIYIMKNQRTTSGKVLILSTSDSWDLQKYGSSIDEKERHSRCTLSEIVERGNNFLQSELVFLPINAQDHWFVGVLNASRKEFQILNSSDSCGEPYKETTHTLILGIQVCIDAALDSRGTLLVRRPERVIEWPISVIRNLPQQKDGCSCGLFALKYMQFWDGSKLTCEFTQDDIDLFRKRLVGELIFSELNEKKENFPYEVRTLLRGIKHKSFLDYFDD